MNTQTELIVHFNKRFGRTMFILFFFLFITTLLFLVLVNSFRTTISLSYFSYVLTFFQIIIGFFLILVTLVWFLLFIQMIDKQPIAILNKQGIETKRHGLIPWRHIEAIYPYAICPDNVENLPVQIQAKKMAVVIKIKKDSFSLVQKQSFFSGKFELFWVKIFGQDRHISLLCTDTPSEEIISFAHRYMKETK